MTADKRKILFVDDERDILEGLKAALRSQRHVWDITFACGGKAAFEALAHTAFEVVLTDMRMPGLDGPAVLEKARELQPRAARIVLSGQTDREAALKTAFTAHQFLAKPCDVKTLRAVIERMCRLATGMPDESRRVLASNVGALPLSAAGRLALTRLIAQPTTSVPEASRLVESDPALSSKLLQVVNSALFGLPRRVTKLSEAITLIGTMMLKDLLVALNDAKGTSLPGVAEGIVDDVQQHSLHTALIAKAIAEAFGHDGHDAFAAGLFHDVGLLLTPRGGVATADHAPLGAYLLGLWGLPEQVVEAVARHHDPFLASVIPAAGPELVHILVWAEALAQPLFPLREVDTPAPQADAALLGLSEDQRAQFQHAAERTFAQVKEQRGPSA